jgi:hypothetical protein
MSFGDTLRAMRLRQEGNAWEAIALKMKIPAEILKTLEPTVRRRHKKFVPHETIEAAK